MQWPKLERDMTPIVREWLEGEGFLVKREMFCAFNCDLTGLHPLDGQWPERRRDFLALPATAFALVAVELKKRDVGAVIQQAAGNRGWADLSYVAMPVGTAPTAEVRCRELGLGLVRVSASGLVLAVEAGGNRPAGVRRGGWCDLARANIIRQFWPLVKARNEKGGRDASHRQSD